MVGLERSRKDVGARKTRGSLAAHFAETSIIFSGAFGRIWAALICARFGPVVFGVCLCH